MYDHFLGSLIKELLTVFSCFVFELLPYSCHLQRYSGETPHQGLVGSDHGRKSSHRKKKKIWEDILKRNQKKSLVLDTVPEADEDEV